jgi:glycosyltransferase involved in cell wall biosynthesis
VTKEQLSLAWLTNLPAPYRKPIWNRLSSKFKLKVYSYLNEENYRGWGQPESKVWSHTFLNKKHIRTAENDLSFSPFGAKKILSNTDAVVVAGWETPIYISTLIRARKVGVPAINFYESTTSSHRFKGPLVRSIRRYIFNLADYIVTSGSASTEAVLATGIAREKIVELFNPVDVEYFAQFASTHRPAQGIGHKFLFVGQLIERKNLLAAIKAFASIANPEDSFTIAGKGPLQPQIEKLIAELKLQRQVHLVGHKSQEELAELYAISHTLVMPSTNEVWGLVANEALATGMHAITSDVAGVSEFIKEMKGAYICTSEQSSIATKMSQSRQDYLGPIKDPEILKFTPEKFADEFIANLLNKSIV